MADLVAAVDVGTGSARAGVFDPAGRLLGRAEHPIALFEPCPDHAEQDSEDIWRAVCTAVRAARSEAAVPSDRIAGIAFDATCSLVLLDAEGRPLSVSTTGEPRWNTILWMDHRARAEAAACTATGHEVLEELGGVMSPEMQIPKLMWLKRHLPAQWARAAYAFDLADYLAWRACGSEARSICTLACKWTYGGRDGAGWRQDFLRAIDLADLRARAGLPDAAAAVGTDLGPLTSAAAVDLGLGHEVRVAAGLIDAHAGTLGVLGGLADAKRARSAALIAGTSNCLMALTDAPVAAPGLWGPCRDVVLPGLWMIEGGQSASGALLDHACRLGANAPSADLHDRIWRRIGELRAIDGWDLAGATHVLPDFRGSRSRAAATSAHGVISGLSLDASFDGMCRLYWRTAVAIALGLRAVLDSMRTAGCTIDTLHLTGGHARNVALSALYATATDTNIVAHAGSDAVLRGAAVAASVGAGLHADLATAARALRPVGSALSPDRTGRARLDRDYRIMTEMHRQRAQIDALSRGIDEDWT